ncbi:MAG: hypothetical protein N2578_08275, partial [Bdellovibrionaceae bacterium]|nr:hypothetical protein [Pseudobdellovibrionaceae bacterium]
QHRLNKIEDLERVSSQINGCEVDLRSDVKKNGQIHLSHDPWSLGDDFEQWLVCYKKKSLSGPLILNTKEDGLEKRVIELMSRYKISNYFFLDTTIPTLVKYLETPAAKHFSVRVSKFESPLTSRHLVDRAGWIWLDCFDGVPMTLGQLHGVELKKICLVSPEIQVAGAPVTEEFVQLGRKCAAICTKVPDVWKVFVSN